MRNSMIHINPSHSVGSLTNNNGIINSNPGSSPTIDIKYKLLESENAKLKHDLQIANEKAAQQSSLIERYEKKWEFLKEEARKRRNSKSSVNTGITFLENSLNNQSDMIIPSVSQLETLSIIDNFSNESNKQ